MVAGTRDKRRLIGVLGTAARVALGTALLGSVVEGHISGDFRPPPWALGLLGFPAATLAWHRWRTRRSPGRLEAIAIAGHPAGLGVFLALYLSWWYASALDVTSDAVLLFYSSSLVLAAASGSGGCEVLAFSNWVLRREDEMGCALFEPVDRLEGRSRPRPDLGYPAQERLPPLSSRTSPSPR